MNPTLAAVVVLYNPDSSLQQNIASYIDNVSLIYVIDNSTQDDPDLIRALKHMSHVKYIKMPDNMGIAAALNTACNLALREGFTWLLTMDQDSMATNEMIEKLVAYTSEEELAIISPYHASKYAPVSDLDEKSSYKTSVMTSGNLLNLHLYQIIGPFTEALFIDFVDHDYCFRALKNNFKVLQVNHAILEHNLGDLRQHKFLNFTFHSTNHPAVRKYYIFRNRAYIIKKYKKAYPEFCQREFRRFFTDVIVLLLYEKDKFRKLKMMLTGLKDFFSGKMGAYAR